MFAIYSSGGKYISLVNASYTLCGALLFLVLCGGGGTRKNMCVCVCVCVWYIYIYKYTRNKIQYAA